jgi:hypothetical protein
MTEECTDGTIDGWPCSVTIVGDGYQGFEVTAAAYTNEADESAPFEIAHRIEACQSYDLKTKKAARDFAERSGFVPDSKWGEMTE